MTLSRLMKIGGLIFLMMALLVAWSVYSLHGSIKEGARSGKEEAEIRHLVVELAAASDYLTDQMRRYVISGDVVFKDNYWREVNETKTRDRVIESLTALNVPKEHFALVDEAKKNSDALIKTESEAEKAVSENNFALAQALMFGSQYDKDKQTIMKPISEFQEKLIHYASERAMFADVGIMRSILLSSVLTFSMVFIVVLIFLTILKKLSTLKTLDNKLKELASAGGDLTKRIPISGKDEIASLAGAFNDFLESLRKIIVRANLVVDDVLGNAENLSAISEETNAAMEEVKASIDHTATLSEDNSAALQQCNSGVEEMSAGADMVARSATESAAFISHTTSASHHAIESMAGVIDGMNTVNESSRLNEEKMGQLVGAVEKISSFVSVITGIADQTNLLALNAAIEAARAGDAGRGFAVVAEEVRKLAEESARAARNVNEIIGVLEMSAKESIDTAITSGKLLTETLSQAAKAQSELNGALQQMDKANESIQNIASVAGEQAISSKEMAKAIDSATQTTVAVVQTLSNIRHSGEETAQAAQGVAEQSQELTRHVQELEDVLSRFKVEESSKAPYFLGGGEGRA